MARLDLPPSISSGVHSFLLNDELLLFSEHARTIFRLNSSAALIWCCLEDGLDRQAIVQELQHAFDLPVARVESDLDLILKEWADCGLLGQAGYSAEADDESIDKTDIPQPSVNVDVYPAERHYQMLDTVFRLRFSEPSLEQFARSVFAHLAVSEDQPFDLSFDLLKDKQGFYLFKNGELIDHCETEQELGPVLHGQAVAAVYSRAAFLIAFHAAAVSNGKECVVFPAVSGGGKSTLTAALIASGFQYCTDEMVLLQQQTHDVKAIPAGIGIKTGSVPALQPYYPAIENLPNYLRVDGQRVRYLLPDKDSLPNDMTQSYPIHSLVFPAYQKESGMSFNSVSPAEALCRLTDAGSDMEGGLDVERVTQLVDWIRGVSCYELRYHDLNDAIASIKHLLS